jgi:hypothetical protein
MLVSEEELAWALDTHIDFAREILDRIRARQHGEPGPKPLPVEELINRIRRHQESEEKRAFAPVKDEKPLPEALQANRNV